jgi:hypothetical protein
MTEMKWEYEIHIRPNLGDWDNLQQESENHFLDIMGRDGGWELTSVLKVSSEHETPKGLSEDNGHLKYYFKRPRRPKTEEQLDEAQIEKGARYLSKFLGKTE